MESDPSDLSTAEHSKARAEFTREKLLQTRKQWYEKTASPNLEKDSSKLRNLARILNEETPSRSMTVLRAHNTLLTDKKAANELAQLYRRESTLPLTPKKVGDMKEKLKQEEKQKHIPNPCLNSTLKISELDSVVRNLKPKKAPWPDGVSNDMQKHLGPIARKTLLESLHVDDLAAWTSAEHTSTATHVMQETINRVSSWADEWCMEIICSKTRTTLFSLSTVKEKVTLRLENMPIPQVYNTTFLGVILDTRLTWKTHLEAAVARSTRKLGLLKLVGTTWVADTNILRRVYRGSVRPTMEYATSSWDTASNANKSKLDKVQNVIVSHCWCHENNTHQGDGEESGPGAPGTLKNI